MELTLYIKDEHIETVNIDTREAITYSQREGMLRDHEGYLKTKYRKDILVTKDWEIRLTAPSKMHEEKISEKEMNEFDEIATAALLKDAMINTTKNGNKKK